MSPLESVRAQVPITVCTVSYHHASHLRLNIALAKTLNADADIRWMVGENTPTDSPLRLDAADLPNVEVVATEGLIPDRPVAQDFHTGALTALIERVTTRYMLILDPDFYIVASDWLHDVIDYMQAHQLALLGAPWHPRHIRKYRYFPAVHCTFVDRQAFQQRPYSVKNIHHYRRGLALKAHYVAPGVPASKLQLKFRNLVMGRLFAPRWKRSWAIRDTGSALFARYWAGEAITNECLTPVFDPAEELDVLPRFMDTFLPEDLSYTPKHPNSYTRTGGFIRPSEDTADWEQFLWRGKPFGFHMRGNSNREQRDPQAEVALAHQIIESLIPAHKNT